MHSAEQPVHNQEPQQELQVSAKNQTFTLTEDELEDQSLDLAATIDFTKNGMHLFFKHIFNRPEYSSELLPYSFTHLYQMLEWGNRSNQSRPYIKAVLRLFTIKIKSAPFVVNYELERLLECLPALVIPYLQTPSDLKLKTPNEQMIADIRAADHIHQAVFTLIDNVVDRVYWSIEDGRDIWTNFEKICSQLARLVEQGLLLRDEADILLWGIVYRLENFLKLAGDRISQDFFDTARLALAKDINGLDNFAELEEALTTKRDVVQRALVRALTHLQVQQNLKF